MKESSRQSRNVLQVPEDMEQAARMLHLQQPMSQAVCFSLLRGHVLAEPGKARVSESQKTKHCRDRLGRLKSSCWSCTVHRLRRISGTVPAQGPLLKFSSGYIQVDSLMAMQTMRKAGASSHVHDRALRYETRIQNTTPFPALNLC